MACPVWFRLRRRRTGRLFARRDKVADTRPLGWDPSPLPLGTSTVPRRGGGGGARRRREGSPNQPEQAGPTGRLPIAATPEQVELTGRIDVVRVLADDRGERAHRLELPPRRLQDPS